MYGNGNLIPVGKCGACGGVVSVPCVFWSVNRPVPQCESCGRFADETARLPVMPMLPQGRQGPAPVVRPLRRVKPRRLSAYGDDVPKWWRPQRPRRNEFWLTASTDLGAVLKQ